MISPWLMVLLGSMSALFVLESEAAQCALVGGCLGVRPEDIFPHPMVLSYLNHSVILLLALPIAAFLRWFRRRRYDELPTNTIEKRPSHTVEVVIEVFAVLRDRRMTLRYFLLATVFLMGDVFWYWALSLTRVAEGTLLSETICIFALIFSSLLLGDPITGRKLKWITVVCLGAVIALWDALVHSDVAELTSLGNVTMPQVTGMRGDAVDPFESSRFLGDVFAILTVVLYALYEVLPLTHYFKEESEGDAAGEAHPLEHLEQGLIVSGRVGLVTLLSFWGLWVYAGELPHGSCLAALALNAFSNAGFATCFIAAAHICSPTLVAVACVMELPLAALFDVFIKRERGLTPNEAIGGAFIVSGFLGLSSG